MTQKGKTPAQGGGSAVEACSDSGKRQNDNSIDTNKSIAENYWPTSFEVFHRTPESKHYFFGDDLLAERVSLVWALARWIGSAIKVCDRLALKREIDRGVSLLESGEIVGMRIVAGPVCLGVCCWSGPVCLGDELVMTVDPATGTVNHSTGMLDGNAYPLGGARLRFGGAGHAH